MSAGCLGVAHLPKCGGSAVRAAVSRIDGAYVGQPYHDLQHFGDPRLVAALPPDKVGEVADIGSLRREAAQYRVLMGHFSVTSLLAAGCRSVALQVREPRARLLSLYRYWQGESEPARAAWGAWGTTLVAAAQLPLAEFLASPPLWPAVDNALWRPVLGRGLPGTAARARRARMPLLSSRRYRAVRGRLSIVEWSSESERFVARICEAVGSSAVPAVERVNVSQVLGGRQSIDATTRARLDRLTGSDRTLLHRLMADGLLPARSAADLDQEFARTADRLGFDLV